MKYFEVQFTLTPCSQDACDLLSALAGEAGFETFEESDNGLLGYVQQELFSAQSLDDVLADFPLDGTKITYEVREAEDRDWNEQWEQEGFEPIAIGDALVIHDGRHLPDDDGTAAPRIAIEIDAQLAFGTGSHETTRMICQMLLEHAPLNDKSVLDCGCGTGILGICALKLGAHCCTAYDIDEWSVGNTRHNSIINRVDNQLCVLHGNATLLDSLSERYDVVMANINRNILLEDMPRFVSVMAPGATLLLSGFYEGDCTLLAAKAQEIGLSLVQAKTEGEWASLELKL